MVRSYRFAQTCRSVQRIDQLHVNDNTIAFATDAAFQNMVRGPESLSRSHARLATRFLRRTIPFYRCATDNAQIANLGQTGQDVVLDAICKEFISLSSLKFSNGRTAIFFPESPLEPIRGAIGRRRNQDQPR